MRVRVRINDNGKLTVVKVIKELMGVGLKRAKERLDQEWTPSKRPEYYDITTNLDLEELKEKTKEYESRYGISLEFQDVLREERLFELLNSETAQKFLIIGNKAIYGVSEGHYKIEEEKGIVTVQIQNGYREYGGKKVEIENKRIILSFNNCIIEENI